MEQRPTLVDLFSGAGGISHGFERAGFRVAAGLDFDADSIATFTRNHLGARGLVADLAVTRPEDLAEELGIRRGELDCMAGGPPCQGFSRNRAFRHVDGVFVDDPRNHLYWHFFEYVAYFRPRVVIMENVPEILIKANGAFQKAVRDRFGALGYAVQAKVLNAAHYGVPQHRRRAIFLAGRDGASVPFPEPTTSLGARPGRRTPTSRDLLVAKARAADSILPLFESACPVGPSIWDAISDLEGEYAASLDGECAYAREPLTPYQGCRRGVDQRLANHYPWRLTERQLKRIRLLGEGQGYHHLPDDLKVKDGYGSAYRRLQKEAQALTITTWMFHPGSGMFTHPNEDRVLTIREAARVQSFQDSFVFVGRYHSQCRQVGNAVAPLVAQNLGLAVKRALGYVTDEPALDQSVELTLRDARAAVAG